MEAVNSDRLRRGNQGKGYPPSHRETSSGLQILERHLQLIELFNVHDVKYHTQSMNMETTRFTSWPSFRTVLKSNPFIKQIVKLRNFSHWKSSPGFHFVSQQWTIGGRIKGCCFPPERNVSICLHLYVQVLRRRSGVNCGMTRM